MKEILVTIPVQEHHKVYLEGILPDAHFTYVSRAGVTEELIKNAEIILGNVSTGLLAKAERLEFLQLDSAGATEYTVPGVLPECVKLCNATGAYGVSIAEHMVAMVFALKKKLPQYCSNMKVHQWKDEGTVTTIAGSTTLVLGMGDIGSEFARRMYALGSRVLAVRRNRSEKPEYVEGLYQMCQLETLLPQADIVACSLPGTEETYHLLDKEKLCLMKKNAILINVGRGSLIPAQDLAEVLNQGVIGAAGIDVTEIEPLPADSVLWETENLLITPHISGNYHTQDILDKAVKIAGENLAAFVNGTSLKNEVDFETGYRKFIPASNEPGGHAKKKVDKQWKFH